MQRQEGGNETEETFHQASKQKVLINHFILIITKLDVINLALQKEKQSLHSNFPMWCLLRKMIKVSLGH